MKSIPYLTGSSEKVVIVIPLARIDVNNVAPISVDASLVQSDKLCIATLMHSMHICSEYGINEIWDKYHSCCIENGNFTWLRLVKFYPF